MLLHQIKGTHMGLSAGCLLKLDHSRLIPMYNARFTCGHRRSPPLLEIWEENDGGHVE